MPSFKPGLSGFKNLGATTNDSQIAMIQNLALSIISAQVYSIDPSNGNIIAYVLGITPSDVGRSEIKASPLFPNIKNYPLINEVVLVLTSTSNKYEGSTGSSKYYYLTPVNLWNEPESNALALPQQNISPTTQDKSYQEVEAGSSNKSQPTSDTTFKPGTYFNEKGTIKPLLPFEGDVIIEGRFGNSIRFGSTDIISKELTENKSDTPLNLWSNSPNNGDPITIITNTLNNTSTETFSNDSSIWLTSTQKLPITGSSIDYTSYTKNPPTTPDQYAGKPQIVLNSGRLVFNSTLDHILLSSKTSISLNSISSVNVDTNNFVVQSAKIYLGDSEDSLTQPVVLGDDLVSLLTDILSDLNTLTRSLQNQIGVPVGTPLAPTSLTAQLIADKIPSYQRRVGQLLSNTTRTAV